MISKSIDDWFTSTCIRYDMEVQGNSVEYGVVVFGGKLDYSNSLDNVCHEMGHFVEIDDSRCDQESWGLQMPTEYSPEYGHDVAVPETFQACAREIRVSGIEHVLCDFFGINRDIKDSADMIDLFVPGSFYLHHEYPDIPDHGIDIQTIRHGKFVDLIREAITEWPIERIKAEWDRKVALLEQRAAARMNQDAVSHC